MNKTLAVCGGTLVNETWSGSATVLVENGTIVGVQTPSSPIPERFSTIIDATNKIVMPGAVDPHCHVSSEVGEYRQTDDYHSTTRAAVWGGTTTIVDFAIPLPEQTPLEAAIERIELVKGGSWCDVALHGCVVTWSDDLPAQLAKMAELGIRTVKVYTTYRDVLMAEPDTIRRVMQILKSVNGMVYVHAESNHLVEIAQAGQIEKGEMMARHHPATRPEPTEVAAVEDVLSIAAEVDAPVYFVHQTTAAAVAAVAEARARGVRAYSETCPHYLMLDDELYAGADPERFVCCPPLRSRSSVEALALLAAKGHVHSIGSDHCCYDLAQKFRNRSDVRNMPNGMPGVETRLMTMYSELVHKRGIDVTELVRVLCANPARLNGLYPRKGVVAVGADADIVIFDPRDARKLSTDVLHGPSDYTPFDGVSVAGWPQTVIVAGRPIILDGVWASDSESGRYLEVGAIGQV